MAALMRSMIACTRAAPPGKPAPCEPAPSGRTMLAGRSPSGRSPVARAFSSLARPSAACSGVTPSGSSPLSMAAFIRSMIAWVRAARSPPNIGRRPAKEPRRAPRWRIWGRSALRAARASLTASRSALFRTPSPSASNSSMRAWRASSRSVLLGAFSPPRPKSRWALAGVMVTTARAATMTRDVLFIGFLRYLLVQGRQEEFPRPCKESPMPSTPRRVWDEPPLA